MKEQIAENEKYLFFGKKIAQKSVVTLTLKVPITTAADDKICDIFSNFRKK